MHEGDLFSALIKIDSTLFQCYFCVVAESPKRRGRPKKARTYDDLIRVPFFKEHKELILRAAEKATEGRGFGSPSDWIREILISAAKEELGEDES